LNIAFEAMAGKTYTLQQNVTLSSNAWLNLDAVSPASTNRLLEIGVPVTTGGRFYRVVTP
jgi:hypothetical protein